MYLWHMPLKRAGIALVYCLFNCKCLRVILESRLSQLRQIKQSSMVDWVNTPGSIYCLNYMSGHLRLFTLRPREIPIICVCAVIKTARKNSRIREPDSEDEKNAHTRKSRRPNEKQLRMPEFG